MEKKNMVLLTVIAVATLLVAVVGATFAYFSISTNNAFGGGDSDQGKTNITASDAQTADQITVAQASEAGSFTAEGVYPGHKEVAAIKVTAKSAQSTAPNVKITYNTTTNDFADGSLKISLYRKDTEEAVSANYFQCEKKSVESKLYEECAKDETDLGTSLVSTNIVKATSAYTLTASNKVNVSTTGADTFYYVVVEFIDTKADQNAGASGKSLAGQVKVEVV